MSIPFREPLIDTPSALDIISLPTRIWKLSKHLTSRERASMKASLAKSAAPRCSWMRPRRWAVEAVSCRVEQEDELARSVEVGAEVQTNPDSSVSLIFAAGSGSERTSSSHHLQSFFPFAQSHLALRGEVAAGETGVGKAARGRC